MAQKMIELFTNPINWVNWFAPIIILALLNYIYKLFISNIKNLVRRTRFKELKLIKACRRNHYLIYSQITKTSSYFTLFLCSCFLFYVAMFTTPFLAQVKVNKFIYFLGLSPVLLFEFLWLMQDSFTKDLIKSASKIQSFNRGAVQN